MYPSVSSLMSMVKIYIYIYIIACPYMPAIHLIVTLSMYVPSGCLLIELVDLESNYVIIFLNSRCLSYKVLKIKQMNPQYPFKPLPY